MKESYETKAPPTATSQILNEANNSCDVSYASIKKN